MKKLITKENLEYFHDLFLTKISGSLEKHTDDNSIHITEEERARWNEGVPEGGISSVDLENAKQELRDEIANPIGQTAKYDVLNVGQRAPIGPPNFNNAYFSGSLYMGPKEEMPAITGPGAAGGNIYLPKGKALVGLTKDGPKTNPDGTSDSGCRTIGFVSQVMPEDIENNEDSVYIGTNVSRLYLYSKTAYPVVVTKKEVVVIDDSLLPMEDGEPVPQELVESISPIATQEWVSMMFNYLGLIGGKEDVTIYTAASSDATKSFDKTYSSGWTNAKNSWSVSSNGTIGHTRTQGNSQHVPLFQASDWNEMYFKTNDTSWNNTSFILMKAPNYAYGVTLETNTYKLFAIDTNGRRHYDYQEPLKTSLEDANTNQKVVRLKYDGTNKAFVFSSIDSNNDETKLLTIPETAYIGFNEFKDAEVCFGLCANTSSRTQGTILQVVNRPKGFIPSQYLLYDENAVVRQADVNKTNIEIDERLEKLIGDIVEKKIKEFL